MRDTGDAIYVRHNTTELLRVARKEYELEDELQQLLADHPEILEDANINPDGPLRLLLVDREVGIPDGKDGANRWAIDHLFLDQHSIPTFVEVKRSSDSRIRRELIGQMLDYAANARVYWPRNEIRSLVTEKNGSAEKASEAVLKLLGQETNDDPVNIVESFWQKVEENLQTGLVRLLFVADRLPSELRRVIEFLNDQMPKTEVLGVEVRKYVGGDFHAYGASVIGQTESSKITKRSRPTNQPDFLDACPIFARDFLKDVLLQASDRNLVVYWGEKGFSVRAPNQSGKLATVLYCYPPGASGREYSVLQAYVGDIEDSKHQQEVLGKIGAIRGSHQSETYTITLPLRVETMDVADDMLAIIWQVSEDLSKT